MQDISAYYTPDLALQEEIQWLMTRHWKQQLEFMLPEISQLGIKSIVELGCGSGLLSQDLSPEIAYTGIDSNQWFLAKARTRNGNKKHEYKMWDARNWDGHYDLAMAWNFFKHFSLEEWKVLLRKLLLLGEHAAFNVPVSCDGKPFDSGMSYHHIFVREEDVHEVVKSSGHKVVKKTESEKWNEADHVEVKTVSFWTDRIFKESVVEVDVTEEQLEKISEGIKNTICDVENQKMNSPIEETAKPNYKLLQTIQVNGQVVPDWHNYAIRFVETDNGYMPVLYHHGRRVTKQWAFKLNWRQEADPHGDNANTKG